MYSVYLQCRAGAAAPSEADGAAAERHVQLKGMLRLGRKWLEATGPDDPRREHLIRMCILAEDLIKAADPTPAAMTMARELLCANCRRVNAVQEKCPGLPLQRCPLLTGTNS